MTRKIYALDPLPPRLVQEITGKLDNNSFSFFNPQSNFTWEDQLTQLKDAHILIHTQTDITNEILDAAPNLRMIVKYEMRPGTIEPEQLGNRNIIYTKVPCMALFSVAEFTVMMILIQAKEFCTAYEDMKKETWLPDLQPALTTQTKYPYNWVKLKNFNTLYNRSIGIVGMGIVGKSVARLLRPFGMKIRYFDINRLSDEEEREMNLEFTPLDYLFASSDFITIHLKHNDNTEKVIGANLFGSMKPSAYLINTSRGRVIDEDALIDALRNKRIAGAALDVFRFEPLPSDSPLRTLDNVVLTPHIAGIPLDANADLEADLFIQEINKYF